MNKIATIMVCIIMWQLSCVEAQASTSNLSVFSDKPVEELNVEVSKSLVELTELSKSLAGENLQLEELQNQQQNLQSQMEAKQEALGNQLKLVYTTKPLLSSLNILLNSKSYAEIENAVNLLDYLTKKTYGGLNENIVDYDRLMQEHDKLAKIQQSQQEIAANVKQKMDLLSDNGILPRSRQLNVPDEIKYRDISPYYDKIIYWLNQRGSLEASREYLDIINAAGQVWDVDPLLLLAITGQEQSFVPAQDLDAEKIINNPWNVFHSWQEFQAGFSISAMWAANTVARLSQQPPGDTNLIRWINGYSDEGRDNPAYGYADDPNWWVGVNQYYDELKNICF